MAEHNGPAINAVNWTLFGIALVAVVLRLIARTRRKNLLGWDDYLMALSLLLNFVTCICSSMAISYGTGKHIDALTPEQIPSAILWGIIATDIGILSDATPKLAVALLINSILNPKPLMRCFTVTIATVNICLAISLVIVSFVQCHPISHQWEREKIPGSCWSPLVFANYGLSVGVFASTIDLIFSIYPPFVVSRLKMQLRKKITVMIIFSLGLFAFFTTLFKTAAEIPKLKYAQVDFSQVIGQIILWTNIEASVVITAGSIPTWGWLFQTESFSRFASWISLLSTRATRLSERLSSQGGEADNESDMVRLKMGHKNPQESQGVSLQSIDRIERVAYS